MKEIRSKIVIDKKLADQLFAKQWIVYAKKPFGNPQSVTMFLKPWLSNSNCQNVNFSVTSESVNQRQP